MASLRVAGEFIDYPVVEKARRVLAAAEHERAEEAELLTEQLSRNRAYLGDAGQARVEGACVVVLGVGGVGSHVAQLLGRTGVRRLRLIDPGRVTERSLESHAVATRADLGAHKGAVLRSVLSRVLPACCVEVVTEQITQENAAALLFGAAAVGGGSSHGGGEGGGASADGSVCNGSRAASCGVDMVVACLPSAPGEPSHTLAAALAACLAARVRCVPVVYASDEPPAAVVRQRFRSLHDVCGSVAARRLVSHTRRLVPHAPPMAAASLLAVHAGETSSIRTHRPGAPTATELAACTGKCTDGSAGIARTDGARAASSMRHGKSSLTDADGTGSKADGSGSGNAGGSARFDASSLSLRGALRAGMGHAAASAVQRSCSHAGTALVRPPSTTSCCSPSKRLRSTIRPQTPWPDGSRSLPPRWAARSSRRGTSAARGPRRHDDHTSQRGTRERARGYEVGGGGLCESGAARVPSVLGMLGAERPQSDAQNARSDRGRPIGVS